MSRNNFNNEEVPKYIKSKNAKKSKAKNRSDHKHEYETVLIGGWFGFAWTERCVVCGRLKEKYTCGFGTQDDGTRRPESFRKGYISSKDYYTADELHERFPDIKIYVRNKDENGYILWGDQDITQIY